MSSIGKHLYDVSRKEASSYLAKSLARSTAKEEVKALVGENMIELFASIFYTDANIESEEKFSDLDSSFLYAIDLVNVYILEVEIMRKEDDPIAHINRIRDGAIRRLVLNLYKACINL